MSGHPSAPTKIKIMLQERKVWARKAIHTQGADTWPREGISMIDVRKKTTQRRRKQEVGIYTRAEREDGVYSS